MAEGAGLDWAHLALCSSLLLIVVLASWLLGLGLERRLVVAAARCAAQLLALCAFVLKPMFERDSLPVIALYLCAMLLLAAREASSRLSYTYAGLYRDFLTAYAFGAGSVVIFAIVFVLELDPWWDATYAVPVSGMLIGNVLTSSALGAQTFLSEIAEGSDRVDLYLVRGATWREASLPATRKALTAALTPTITSMSVMGLVMMPGMMTGQMLGGASPLDAGAYQIMIMYLICVAGCLSSTGTILLATVRLFDRKEHALLRDVLRPKKKDNADILEAVSRWMFTANLNLFGRRRQGYDAVKQGFVVTAVVDPPTLICESSSYSEGKKNKRPVMLECADMTCPRTGLRFDLTLRAGTRTSLTGPTGVGKTQLLKALARTIPSPTGALTLEGEALDAPTWRSRVCYVSQDRPTVTGTPSDLFERALGFYGQRNNKPNEADPKDIARDWGLDASKFQQPWSALSGGEAQRASLAIALALKPRVLLLDEPTSACDEATTRLIEETIIKAKFTCLVITHSETQAARFCDCHVSLKPAASPQLV